MAAASVDTRISAGEALAILFEIATNCIDKKYQFPNQNHLQETLEELAVDSVKYHAKRDRKMQKFSFRQINDAIFNDRKPQIQVKFNKKETLQLEDCYKKLFYDLLCHLLKVQFIFHNFFKALICLIVE